MRMDKFGTRSSSNFECILKHIVKSIVFIISEIDAYVLKYDFNVYKKKYLSYIKKPLFYYGL